MLYKNIGSFARIGIATVCTKYHDANRSLFEHERVIVSISDRHNMLRVETPYVFAFGKRRSGRRQANPFGGEFEKAIARLVIVVVGHYMKIDSAGECRQLRLDSIDQSTTHKKCSPLPMMNETCHLYTSNFLHCSH